MKDEHKRKDELIRELGQFRQRLGELEKTATRPKQAEDDLRESEDRYRAIFETTATATIIVDEDTTISMANTEFERLSGYSKGEIEGKRSWADFVARKDDLERMKEYHDLRRIDPNAAPREYEYKFIDRKGAVPDIFGTVAMIPGTKKSVGSFWDITDRKKAEETVRESEEKYRSLVESTEDSIYLVDRDCRYLLIASHRL
jgi:PAS domain S-box-containing protein